MGFDEDGTWRLAARLDADRGAVVDGALRHHHDRLIAAHRGDGPFPTVRDALVRMAEHSLTDHDTDVALPAALVVLHVDETSGTARLHQGPVLDRQLAGLVSCDAAVQVQHDHGRRAIGVGRTRRTVPAALRRHVEHRDGGCRVPGCGRRFVQVHHVQHWSHGGATDPDNLIALCAAHHRAHHLGRLGIAGSTPRHPTGSPSPTNGDVPCPPWCRPPHPTSTAGHHPTPPPTATPTADGSTPATSSSSPPTGSNADSPRLGHATVPTTCSPAEPGAAGAISCRCGSWRSGRGGRRCGGGARSPRWRRRCRGRRRRGVRGRRRGGRPPRCRRRRR